MDFWDAWIAEGDAAGDAPTGEEWGWYTKSRDALLIRPGERFYVAAHGRIRGYALVTRIVREGATLVICRKAGAVACTIAETVPGFRGLLARWWEYDAERPFPDWKTAGVVSAFDRRAAKRKQLRAPPPPAFDFGGES